MDIKYCKECDMEKVITDFGKDKSQKDGLRTICKLCASRKSREYRKTPRGKLYVKEYNNLPHVKSFRNEWSKKWEKTPEGKEWIKKYNKTPNRQEVIKLYETSINGKISRKKAIDNFKKSGKCKITKDKYNHSPEGKLRRKIYRKTTKGNVATRRASHKRRVNGENTEATLTTEQWLKILKEHPYCCICGEVFIEDDKIVEYKDKLTQEHIVPVSLGGGYTYENILPAHLGCNSKKQDRLDKGKLNTWFYLYKK